MTDHLTERDGPRDECGVFGIYAPGHDVARLAYFALYALQHRGQESAGIATAAERPHHGACATRASSTRCSTSRSCARCRATWRSATSATRRPAPARGRTRSPSARADRREVALAHNGNLINAVELHAELRERGRLVPLDLGLRDHRRAALHASRRTTIEDALVDVMPRLEGAYSTVVMTKDRVVAFRDPAGLRPLSLACSATATASRRRPARSTSSAPSSCATSQPGEIVSLDAGRPADAPGREGARARAVRVRAHLLRAARTRGWAARCCRSRAAGWARSSRARRRSRPTS